MRSQARLVAPAVIGWCAVGVLVGVPDLLAPTAVVLWLTAAGGLAVAVVLPRTRSVLAILIVVATVAALLVSSAASINAARNSALLNDAAEHHRYLTLTAVLDVDTRSEVHGGPTSVTITSATVGAKHKDNVSIPALVFGEVPAVGLGASIVVNGTLSSAQAGDRVRFLVFARGRPALDSGPPWFVEWANELRQGFHQLALELPGDGGALLPGLSIGDTSAVSDPLDHAMKVTSLSHLTAVSGANCAVIVGLVMLVMGGLGARRRSRIVVSLVVLIAFVVLVTPSASVLRAAVMAALVLGSLATGRPTRGLAVLSVAVIALLVADPWLSRDYGFILSVLATAGLLVLAGPLARVLSRWLPGPLAAVISIPLAAQLACQPVLILLNPAIPVYGVVANLLAEPAAPVATVLGLFSCASLPIFEPFARISAYLAWVPSAWIAALARFFSSAPGSQAPWLPGLTGVVLLAVVTSLVLVVMLRPRYSSTPVLSSVLALILVGYSGILIGSQLGHRAAIPADWQIASCDVGQGDAVLVRSEGKFALIDTGPDPELLLECLDALEIRTIDLLILSHFDLDHVGGTAAVFGRVDRALVGPDTDETALALRESLRVSGAVVEQVARGASGMLGDFRWDVLWPPKRLGTAEIGNPASVTVRFEGVGACPAGCLSSIFLGDLGEQAQSRMRGVAHPGAVDVVKVAHHGSADQYEPLYQQLAASVGIIGVGVDNTYGHPTESLLAILERAGTVVARTDLEGMIVLSPARGGGVQVWTQRAPPPVVGAH